MSYRLISALALVAIVTSASPVAAQTPAAAPAAMPAVTHLVYQFGYNTPAASQGTGTGTTTIDIKGMAADGGMTITATDDWWNTVNPRQTYTCEVYATGGVTCATPPYAISPVQIAIVPLLGRSYFTALSASPTSTWKANYAIKATFDPSGNTGFAGQPTTWNCSYDLTGKGTAPNSAPLLLVHADGSMVQEGGPARTIKQKANYLYDPRISMPVYVDEEANLIPRQGIDRFTIQMKLIQT